MYLSHLQISNIQTFVGKSQGDGASEPNSCDTQEETTSPIKHLNSASNQCSQHLPDKNSSKNTENGVCICIFAMIQFVNF